MATAGATEAAAATATISSTAADQSTESSAVHSSTAKTGQVRATGPGQLLNVRAVQRSPVRAVQSSTNNTTSPHQDPDEYQARGDRRALQTWFSGHMSETLIDCSEHTAARGFDACDVDEESPDWASNYAELAADTDSDRDDAAAQGFTAAGADQRAFTEQT